MNFKKYKILKTVNISKASNFLVKMGTLSALILDSLPTEDMLANKASVNIDKLQVLMSIFEILATNNLRSNSYNYMQKHCLEDNKIEINQYSDEFLRKRRRRS